MYYSDRGISTFLEGYNDEDPNAESHGSGVIEFFSHRYDKDVRGLTLFSNRGTIGLRTETRDIVLDAARRIRLLADRVVLYSQTLHTNSIGTDTGTNFYVGVSGTNDGELRITNKLYYNDGNPRYLDLRAHTANIRQIRNTADNGFFYVGADLGTRITSWGTNENPSIIYRPIQASDFQVRVVENQK